MNENQEKNRETRIKQQRNVLIRNLIICLAIIAVFTIAFWVINRNAQGTEITYNEFQSQLEVGNIAQIELNQSKVQIYYQDGTAHWLYNRNSLENSIVELVNTMYETGEIDKVPKILFGTTTTISIMSILYPVLMIVIFIVMIVLILRQIKGANNKSFEFVKNRARVYPSKTKFTDVAGEDEEKAELEDIVDFLKNPKKYTDVGAKIPKGVLLVGPPGTGKTLLARAVAGEANVPFFTISGSDFMELFVGVGASRVRDLFETAKKAKPCIIFIDEIDAVGRQRGAGMGGGNDEREQTLNQLLVQMDGFEDNEGIIVMAATNRVDILDPALLRPGRFDRRVNINIPDIKGREEILKVHSRNKPLSNKIDFKTIARITSGFTGAEIENLLNEAAIFVAKENRAFITTKDIQKALMKVTLGPQKRSRVILESDRKNTAIHEAGHAFISKVTMPSTPVHEVSIIPRGGAGGYTLSTDGDEIFYYKNKLLYKIQMLLGGITAEKLFVGDVSTGASSDLKRATNIARRMVTEWGMSSELGLVYCGGEDEVFLGRNYQERATYGEAQATKIDIEVKKIIDECQAKTEKILKEYEKQLNVMVEVLCEKETIYAEEIDMIISGKSKEEIVAYIDGKDSGSNDEPETIKQEVSAECKEQANKIIDDIKNNPEKSTMDIVDELLKAAQEREKSLKVEESKIDENQDTNYSKEDVSRETRKNETVEEDVSQETNVDKIAEENVSHETKVASKPKTTRKKAVEKDDASKEKKTTTRAKKTKIENKESNDN